LVGRQWVELEQLFLFQLLLGLGLFIERIELLFLLELLFLVELLVVERRWRRLRWMKDVPRVRRAAREVHDVPTSADVAPVVLDLSSDFTAYRCQ
jgi:hypothetical protein